ncbi:uncharacterized protein LOC115238220 [Formica exsecta]|uniref:uncharacterized protein LOC115238220 n=1 Tax=Formica exsecta TaxID=72781 RepID=UPI001143A89E|nr:uncharacterized protein LOC115238220 [Formica exsecta]
MAVTAWNAWNVARHAAPAQSHVAIHRLFGPLSNVSLIFLPKRPPAQTENQDLNPNVVKRVSACSSQRPGQDRAERKKEESPVMISSRLNSTSWRESQGRIFDCRSEGSKSKNPSSVHNGNKFSHMTCYDIFWSIASK